MSKKKTKYISPIDAIDSKLPHVELNEPIEPTKFDRHMRRARKNDISARREAFLNQSKADSERDDQRQGICPSVY